MTGSILTLNAGSSSLKFALFGIQAGARPPLPAGRSRTSTRRRICSPGTPTGNVLTERRLDAHGDHPFAAALDALLAFADAHLGTGGLGAAGHRIVHGGADHVAPEIVTPALVGALQALTPLDPLHMPHNLAPIRAIAAARPRLRQVACFDTAFHHTLPPVARRLSLPRSLEAEGIRRYGFHGLSYEYIAGRLAIQGQARTPAKSGGRVIVAHLGAGASLCALMDGVSIETTTGFSALDGLVMATRCGRLDPGVILHLGRMGRSFADIEDMLYRHSGLLGVSGISGDVRVLLASPDAHARDALELFAYRIACEAGGLVSALGGLDGLVFTAGIGERSPAVRRAVCDRLGWLGVRLDEAANEAGATVISTPASSIAVQVIPTDEEAMIAQHTAKLLQKAAA